MGDEHYEQLLVLWVESLPIARETEVQSLVKSYQRLKKWYVMPPCLTLIIIRYVSRVKWSNSGEGVVPSPYTSVKLLLKRETSGRPRLRSSTFTYLLESSSSLRRDNNRDSLSQSIPIGDHSWQVL